MKGYVAKKIRFGEIAEILYKAVCQWTPTGKARGTSIKYPPTPLRAVALRRASAKASEGYPPSAKSAEAAIL